MDNSKITAQIQKLLDKTREKKLPWKYANANTVRWVRQDGSRLFTVTLTVQQTPLGINRINNYSLTIQATNPNEIVLQINTTTDETYRVILSELFAEAMNLSREGSSDIIDKLLGDL
ncbi:MAG: hypothetical protein IPJ79_08095 [Bacteroidetes bacterium]|nr:hypothetical protein [Bacteroidota bacterium]